MNIHIATTDAEITACYPVMRELRPTLQRTNMRKENAGYQQMHLDSGIQRKDAHRFYEREGMTMASFHFVENIAPNKVLQGDD